MTLSDDEIRKLAQSLSEPPERANAEHILELITTKRLRRPLLRRPPLRLIYQNFARGEQGLSSARLHNKHHLMHST